MPLTGKQIKLEIMVFSGISQSQQDKHLFSHMQNLDLRMNTFMYVYTRGIKAEGRMHGKRGVKGEENERLTGGQERQNIALLPSC